MAVFDINRPAHGVRQGLLQRLRAEVISRTLSWSTRRATRKSMSRLTERQLADLGIVRGDLDQLS